MSRRRLTMDWLLPTLGFVVTLGAVGVTSKLALRTLRWQDLILWTTVVYLGVSIFVLLTKQGSFGSGRDVWWALFTAVLAITSLICLYLALGKAPASKVVPVSAAYPAFTLLLAALVLSEKISLPQVGGLLLVIGGVVLITGSS